MELKTVKDAFDHVTKKQRICSSKCNEAVDQIGHEIEQALLKLQTTDDHKPILANLKAKLKELGPLAHLEPAQKELNVALSKYPKQLEKTFNPDISKAYRTHNSDFDFHIIDRIIAGHLYRAGLFEAGDRFASEAGIEDPGSMKAPFVEMYHIVQAMRTRDLGPALKWAAVNSDTLRKSGSDLELKLHRLQYVDILQNRGRDDALKYARAHLSPFASSHMAEIQKLMACLLWAGKLENSPYSDLLSPVNWEKLAEEFAKQFCNGLGQSFESPLSVTVAAGAQGLPTLLKLMNVMVGKKQEWQSMKQLPVPIDLDREFQFHTIFVCPVSRDQATEENPPMLMSCGHVLCKQSIMKLSKSGTKSFKCPYCPSEIEASQCRQLYF